MTAKSFTVLIDIIARNSAAAGLSAVAAQVMGLNQHTVSATTNMRNLQAAIGGVGAVMLGSAMLKGLGALTKSGEVYLEQINQARTMGLSQLEIANLELAARQTSAKVMTTTYEQNLRAGRELLMVFNKQEDAFRYLPKLQAMASNIFVGSKASGKPISMDKATDMTYEAARALDLWNITQDSAKTMRVLDGMQKAGTAYGYKITPQDFYMSAKYMKGVTPEEEFITKRLPVLMSDLGASTAGVAVNQMNRVLVAGRSDHKTAKALQGLGLVSSDGIVLNNAGQIKGIKAGGVMGSDLAQTNQYAWFQKYFLPAMAKKGGFSLAALRNDNDPAHAAAVATAKLIINEAFGGNRNQLQAAMMYATQQGKFDRDARNMGRVQGISEQQLTNMRGSPALAREGMAAQWNNVKTALGLALAPATTQLMISFAQGLNKIAQAITAHPTVTKVLMWLAVGIAGLLVVLGGVAIVAAGIAAIAAIGLVPILVIVGIVTAIGAVIALIYAIDWAGTWAALKKGCGEFFSNIITWFKSLPARLWEGIKGGANAYGEALVAQGGGAGAPGVSVEAMRGFANPQRRTVAPALPHQTGAARMEKMSFSGDVVLDGNKVGYALGRGMPGGGSGFDPGLGNPFVTA